MDQNKNKKISQENKGQNVFSVSEKSSVQPVEIPFLDQALQTAQEAASEASKVLLKYYGHLKAVDTKEKASLVTEADRESEQVIRRILKRDFPHFSILGEEEGLERPHSDEPGLWIIDPLDGTTNYVHQFPIFCISIALEWKTEVVLGLVEVPLLQSTYKAQKKKGAFLNSKPLRVSQNESLDQALVATGLYPYSSDKDLKWQMKLFEKMVRNTRGVRRAGSAAYDLCLVAQGVFHAFWEKHLKPWDTAAGILLIQEAGGVVKTYKGEKFYPCSQSIVASNSKLLPKVLQLIQEEELHLET